MVYSLHFIFLGVRDSLRLIGITRQAYYQNSWKAIDTIIEEELVLQQLKQIINNHPRLGTRKLYEKLQPFMIKNCIKMEEILCSIWREVC